MTSILLTYTPPPQQQTTSEDFLTLSEYHLAPNMGCNWHIMNHVWDNTTIWT